MEYVFNAELSAIRELLSMIVTADTTRQVQSEIVLNRDERSAYAFIAMPRKHSEGCDQMACALRSDLEASYNDHRVYMGKFGTVALHFYFTGTKPFDQESLDHLDDVSRSRDPWSYRLRDGLESAHDPTSSKRSTRPSRVHSRTATKSSSPEDAVVDLGHLDALLNDGRMRFTVIPSGFDDTQVYLRIFSLEAVQLTALLPVIHDHGMVVVDQATELTLRDDDAQSSLSSCRARSL